MTSPSPLAFFTICSKNFIAYALTLTASIREHHPGANVYVALCDRLDGAFDPAELPFELVQLEQLAIPDLAGMIERYNITELNTSIKPFVFEWLFNQRGERRVVYLDPDILVVSPLVDVDRRLGAEADAILTPHVLDPADGGVEIDDIKMLQLGIYNLGFCALHDTPRVQEIVRWWQRRLDKHCVIDIPNGLFVDQKWADLLPCFIPRTHILQHPGYNVAYWNLQQRRVVRGPSGWTANGQPLVFVHFSGNNLNDETVFSRHSWQLNAANVGEINDLLGEYRRRVFGNDHARWSRMPYAFNWNGASGKNEHTPQEAAAGGAASAASPAAVGVWPPPVRRDSRWRNAMITLGRAREHAGGWGPMLMKGVSVFRRGGMPLVRDTVRNLNLIYPLRRRAVNARPLAVAEYPGPMAPLPGADTHRGGRGKLLFIDWSTPRPDCDAGSITAFYLMKILVDLGYEVVFVPSDLLVLGHYTEAVRALGVRCLSADDIGTVEAHLQAEGATYTHALLCRAPIAALYIDQIRAHAPAARIILNTSDLHYLRDLREAELSGDAARIEAALRWKAHELSIIRACDHSIVMSDHELQILQHELPGADIHLVPLMFVDIPGRSAGFAARKDMLFIGGFPHPPNVDAVVWFCEKIWPLVRPRLPGVRVHLIGNKPTDAVHALGAIEGVNVVGYVEDLKPWFDGIRMSIAPLRYGAGIKGKLGTSLSFGVPSVATTIAVEGMGIRDGIEALVADDEQAFADAVVRLYTDEALWERISVEGLRFVTDTYSLDAGLRRVDAFLRTVESGLPAFPGAFVADADAYARHFAAVQPKFAARLAEEAALIPPGIDPPHVEGFVVEGWCAMCRAPSVFQASFMYSCSTRPDGGPMPNWREHLDCRECGFINRMRAAVHLLETQVRPATDADLYITEQSTALFRWLQTRYPRLQGSEYLGDRVPRGETLDGLRNEDLTATTWPDARFDVVLSLDVLEHVPSSTAAFAECFRILRPGGALVWAAPFAFDDEGRLRDSNVVRAYIDAEGTLVHVLEPEYHGNPVDPENGALCFQYFGLEVLTQLREAGFERPELVFYWSRPLGYLGREQVLCIARKPVSAAPATSTDPNGSLP
jgi:glycosyltransferase involved in cell wall biosynthesis/SAM-dependent methyltransferase